MKNLLFTSLFVLSTLFTAFASNVDGAITLLESASVEVSTIEVEGESLFKTVNFDANQEILEFETESEINYIRIFNEEGTLEFQLPVMSKKVKISKALFSGGSYKLGFLIKDVDQIKFTNVVVR